MTEAEVLRDLNRIGTSQIAMHRLCTELAIVAMYCPEYVRFDAIVPISDDDVPIAREIAEFLKLLLGREIESFPLQSDPFGEKIAGKRILLVEEDFHEGYRADGAIETVRDHGGDVVCIGAIYSSSKKLPYIPVPKICCLAELL